MEEINAVLTEFLSLKQELKLKETRLKEIQTWCKEQGSFATDVYVCSVTDRSRTGLVGLEKAIEALGKELLEQHDLITTSTFSVVSVSVRSA